TENRSCAEAKSCGTSLVADRNPLWLYIRFNGNLGRYIRTIPDENGKDRYVLFVEIGPQGDVAARYHYVLEFSKDELKLTELKINLTAGMPGHNRSLPLFVKTAAGSTPA